MESTPPTPKSPRWMRVLLVLSLALNLMILGLVVGSFVSGGGKPSGKSGPRDTGFGPISRALSPEDRRDLGRDIRRATRSMAPAMKSEWNAVLETLRMEEFDPSALTEVFGTQREANTARMEIAQTTLIAHIAQMTRDERLAFAERLEEALSKPLRPRN